MKKLVFLALILLLPLASIRCQDIFYDTISTTIYRVDSVTIYENPPPRKVKDTVLIERVDSVWIPPPEPEPPPSGLPEMTPPTQGIANVESKFNSDRCVNFTTADDGTIYLGVVKHDLSNWIITSSGRKLNLNHSNKDEAILIILKISQLVDWSWWTVAIPFLAYVGIAALLILALAVVVKLEKK